jgi:hypothetical protein
MAAALPLCPHCGGVIAPAAPDLTQRAYLTMLQLADYLGFTLPKTRHWLRRNPDVRRAREGKYVIVWKQDVDAELGAHARVQERRRTA